MIFKFIWLRHRKYIFRPNVNVRNIENQSGQICATVRRECIHAINHAPLYQNHVAVGGHDNKIEEESTANFWIAEKIPQWNDCDRSKQTLWQRWMPYQFIGIFLYRMDLLPMRQGTQSWLAMCRASESNSCRCLGLSCVSMQPSMLRQLPTCVTAAPSSRSLDTWVSETSYIYTSVNGIMTIPDGKNSEKLN